jgi:hypothetical protein
MHGELSIGGNPNGHASYLVFGLLFLPSFDGIAAGAVRNENSVVLSLLYVYL